MTRTRMAVLLVPLMLFVLPALLIGQAKQNPQPKPLVFTHVTVIDATGAPAKPDMTVVIAGDRITALGKTEELTVPKNAQVVDATGKFLIPGLWDMHVHTLQSERTGSPEVHQTFFPLFIVNGVTGVRDMNGDLELLNQLQEEIAHGTLLGPRIVAAGPLVDGVVWPFGSIAVTTETEGRQAVDSLKKLGADFVKVTNLLPRDTYFAIADETKKRGLPLAGHVPFSVSPAEASDAGQHSIEHLDGILVACSATEAELRKQMMETIAKSGPSVLWVTRIRAEAEALDTYSEKKATTLFARFVTNGTWQVPTLVLKRATAYIDDSNFTDDARLKYVPPFLKDSWMKSGGGYKFLVGNHTAADFANEKRILQKQLELVGIMRRAGVEFMAGTDTIDPYIFPGFSLHDELALFVEAGFTPMEALQAATRNPAEFLGKLGELGTIEEGKIADLVVLDADPLEDIRNTKKIAGVVIGGRYLPKEELDKMLAQVEAAARLR